MSQRRWWWFEGKEGKEELTRVELELIELMRERGQQKGRGFTSHVSSEFYTTGKGEGGLRFLGRGRS